MTYLHPDHARFFPRAHRVRAIALPSPVGAYRRAAGVAACIVAIATALALPTSARAGWPLTTAAPVALGFGATYAASDGTPSTHRGVDIAAQAGSSVCSPLSGRVSFAGRVPGVGGGTVLAVTIATAGGSLTLMPLSSAAVKAGANLAEGDAVGQLASEGDGSSSAAHLHVGARKGDLYLDPLSLIAPPTPAPVDVPEPPQPSPAEQPQPSPTEQPQPAGAPGGALAPSMQGAAHAAVVSPSGLLAPQSAAAPAGASAVSAQVVGVGSPTVAVAPGASIAPGVSIAGGIERQAGGSTLDAVSAALATAVNGKSRNRSGSGSPMSALIEWALGAAVRGLQMGARVLAGVLLALGALWPIWRSERRKGISQVSVRPACDDIAAVTGR